MALRNSLIIIIILIISAVSLAAPLAAKDSIPEKAIDHGDIHRLSRERIAITFRDGRLSLHAQDAELTDVLRILAEKTGIDLTLGEGISGRLNLSLEGVSLEEALRQLCASRAVVYDYDQVNHAYRVVQAEAFAALSGNEVSPQLPDAASPVPLPQETGETVAPVTEEVKGERDSQGRLLYQPGELLVRFRAGTEPEQIEALNRRLGSTVLDVGRYNKLYRIRLRKGMSEEEALTRYNASEIVAAAERHALRYPQVSPNDPDFVNNKQWGLEKIRMPAAWDMTRGNSNIVVAVIDSGADFRHPDLAPNLAVGWDFANHDNDPSDKTGHGTHVAGIIAAQGDNGLGGAGIGWRLKVMPLKVQADGSESMLDSDILAAIDYALTSGVRIINCSFGGEAPSPEEYRAFDRLRRAGILAIAAAGNSGSEVAHIYPAYYAHQSYHGYPALDNIIAVAASSATDVLAYFSNFGKMSVDLMAPGENTLSTWLCASATNCGSGYYTESGTSMATPHVAGVAGLILSRNRNLDYLAVKSLLLETVDKIPSVSDKLISGGRLNAAAALAKVIATGDVTGDHVIDLADVIASLRSAAGMESSLPIVPIAALTSDTMIGLEEALFDLQILARLRDQ